MHVVWPIPLGNSITRYRSAPSSEIGDIMEMEDTSERDASEEQSRLGREEKQSVQGYIAIKGTRNGLLLTLEPETPFSELLKALSDRLAEAPGFFRGASLAVDTSRRLLRGSERSQLENLLANYQMSVTSLEQITVVRKDAETEVPSSPALAPGTPVSTGNLDETVQDQRDLREIADTLFLRRTIRSGQAIHHTSNIIVVGDVNPGAEIVAGGDIIVWGVLRGMVHAGYPDNESACVCALHLTPVQLRIAHLLSRPPEGTDVQPRPEVATIRNGRIVVETWVNGHPPRK
ncbi:MAG: septum site-determining protein MinC [Chloroflexi bacterium]|nr:MAG: septum site-determining protein MinC [Chloroflexota bacterium]